MACAFLGNYTFLKMYVSLDARILGIPLPARRPVTKIRMPGEPAVVSERYVNLTIL